MFLTKVIELYPQWVTTCFYFIVEITVPVKLLKTKILILQCIIDFSGTPFDLAQISHDMKLFGVLHTARNIYFTYMTILIANSG